eukprot:TRINITY_DN26354_c0_g2_i2.p1 TRINITY_DN26354_c0_g2~~TRINITY_DN26354_c0_g2_i2.p1  ORF type:complete len:290 (-),score=85.63 TRINITY_DN26354_c0_g2_i2:135-1004(-)
MFAMIFYFLLLVDLAVLSSRLSEYVLVCGWLFPELLLALLGLVSAVVTFSAALTALDFKGNDFDSLPAAILITWEFFIQITGIQQYPSVLKVPLVLCTIMAFMVVTYVFLMNLLLAQLTCAYSAIHKDVVGGAQMKRLAMTVDSMQLVKQQRFHLFVTSLDMDSPCEFNAGDAGPAGGIQLEEPANRNPTSKDRILRVGGSTSRDSPWPEEEKQDMDDTEKIERVELQMKKMEEAVRKRFGGRRHKSGSSSYMSNRTGMTFGSGGSGSSMESMGSGFGSEGGEEETQQV